MKEENDLLLKSFFKRTFFDRWQGLTDNPNFDDIEQMINTSCDLACEYCYFAKFGKILYPPEISHPDMILENLKLVLNWMVENKYAPARLNFFTGEIFAQEIGFKCLEYTYEFYKDKDESVRPKQITIPSNCTFILNDEKVARVESLIEKFRSINMYPAISASIDGKYCEANRPMHTNKADRDDEYYDKVFAFAKKWGIGFHPMVYSDHMESWKQNFMWFQDMFKKFRIPPYFLYLHEVRNVEWNQQQLKDLSDFLQFITWWTFDNLCNEDVDRFIKFVFRDKGFNILSSVVTKVGRGLGCGIQGTFYVRLGDLNIVPCHRTMYPGFEYAKFITENGAITDIKAVNPELAIAIYSMHGANMPYCASCTIRNICTKGCLGSQYEVTGDLFTPIPTVCQMEHVKSVSILKAFKEIGVLDYVLDELNNSPAVTDIKNIMNLGGIGNGT